MPTPVCGSPHPTRPASGLGPPAFGVCLDPWPLSLETKVPSVAGRGGPGGGCGWALSPRPGTCLRVAVVGVWTFGVSGALGALGVRVGVCLGICRFRFRPTLRAFGKHPLGSRRLGALDCTPESGRGAGAGKAWNRRMDPDRDGQVRNPDGRRLTPAGRGLLTGSPPR